VTSTAQRSGSSDLARRTVTGLILAAVVLGSVATPFTFALVVLAITLGSLHELSQLSARQGQGLVFPVAASAVTAYIVLATLGLQHTYEKPLIGATIVASLVVSLFGQRAGFFARSAFTVFGVLYIGWLGSYFLALRNLPHVGMALTFASIVTIALTDIFAMLVGTTIGRTPLTSISPKKTVEGSFGGLCASMLAGAGFALVPVLGISWWDGLIIGAITSIAAQAGDIVESALKRDAHVKDAGTFFGGHGGILDRFDSYTFGGIAFYFALYLTHNLHRFG
jgi:phosphatidate cytidylyltransferase